MHQHAITIEQFAAINERLEVFGRVEKGVSLTTIGKHPVLGVCVLMAGFGAEAILLSQVPYERSLSGQS
jgi:hypothetical protein